MAACTARAWTVSRTSWTRTAAAPARAPARAAAREPPSRSVAWTAVAASSSYFAPSASPFMIDYAVDDMDAFVARLTAKGVEILRRSDDESGRFAWIMDPEGNKIELWEPRRAAP